MTERRVVNLTEATELLGSAFAISMACVIMSLHRKTGLPLEDLQADLALATPLHSDPWTVEVAKQMLTALSQTLDLAKTPPGRA